MKPIQVGIIGGAGYTGGELLRILLRHPKCTIAFVNSVSQEGKKVSEVHKDLLGETELTFSNHKNFTSLDVLFLCSGHGQSSIFFTEYVVPSQVKVIDLSTDFRDESSGFTYGLPELQRDKIIKANKIANPGCFATSIELALLPLANAGLIKDDIHVSAVTGSTGAGQKPGATTHFSWRSNNISVYKAFTHQHLKEIGMSLQLLQSNINFDINFIPYRGTFTRGILANVYTAFDGSLEEALSLFEGYYKDHPFTHVTTQNVDVKMVVNTNKCILQLQKVGKNLLISSIIDNLLKGASGQAVQNMNLVCGIDENTGLNLKPVGF